MFALASINSFFVTIISSESSQVPFTIVQVKIFSPKGISLIVALKILSLSKVIPEFEVQTPYPDAGSFPSKISSI